MSGGIFGSGMGMNPLMATLSPDQQQNLIQLQQKQALGQALLQQGMEPLPAPNATAGGMAYRQSPLNGIANLAKTYLGTKMSMGAAGQEAQLMGQMYGNAFGVTPGAGVSSPAASSAQPDDSGASASDSIPGTGGIGAGMTPANMPAALGAALSGNQSAPQAAATPMQSSPLQLPGRTPQQSLVLSVMAPQAYNQALGQALAPTDATRMAMAAGQDPAQANAGALFKANYVAPTAGRPGGYMRDPQTGALTWLPQVPQGAAPQFNASGQFTGVAPMAGAAQVAQQQAAAQAAGKAQFNIEKGVNLQTGQPGFTTDYNIATGAGAPSASAPGEPGAQQSPSTGPFSGYRPPASAPLAPGLAPGADDIAEGAAKSFNALRDQASSTPTSIDGYNRAEQALLSGVPTGPGSTLGANILGRLNTAGIPVMKGDANGYQSLQKFLANANAQAAGASGYNGSDARFESFSHGQPNAENMNPDALRYAIQYVRGQQAGVQAKYQAAQSFISGNGNSTFNYPQFEAQWNRVYNPDVMIVKSMPNPADQQAYLGQLKQQGKLGDWMKSYQQMQQMGAF